LLEEELAQERTFLRAVIDAIPDQIYVKDNGGRFTDANRATAQSLDVASADELVGRCDFDFFPADVAAGFAAEERAVLDGILPALHRESAIAFKDGQTRWIATTKVPLRDSQGRIIGLVGINNDVTERKRAEDQLHDLNFDLARSQNELLGVLDDLKKSHADLKAAQMQLIEAEKLESVGRIAAGVAHEVKNPLAILLMGIDYLESEPSAADPGVAMILKDMRDAVHRGDAIVRGLLDFSAVRKLDLEPTDLNAIIEKSLLLVRHELVKANLTAVRRFADGLPPVMIDSIKMQQVFVNLFMNAVHAMKQEGTLTVTTRVRTVTDVAHNPGERDADRLRAGELMVEAQVDDTGHGVAADKITKVFDPFFTTKPTGSGTGLGLTVVKKIIELHGGQIQLMNRPEGGVRVVVALRAGSGRVGDSPIGGSGID
jgi:PAS domain S-box-containing protein